ncbi:hypothetical protein CCH79_00018539 [Gambusia affinis]|uniref:ZP domain-containing protein n=1 Tax=Gambusia affinis TaxID=33528 RepID=A0A315V4Q7_GAMAF|nr:hypothetical protein CCH79_00018539 [Gambusia affinis]
MLLSLLPLLLLLSASQASHFLGTMMTYYPKETFADGSVSVILRYKLNYVSCSYSDAWQCSGNCGTETQTLNLSVVEKVTNEWCQREGVITRLLPNNTGFQTVLANGNWIDNIQNGIVSWRALTAVEMRNRSDIGKPNTSPQTSILPALRIPSNCAKNINLLAFDPDGDEVRCRYGNTSASECNPCTPPSVLSVSSSCSLSFSPTNSSTEIPYAVQLVIEDFPKQNIILTQTDGSQVIKDELIRRGLPPDIKVRLLSDGSVQSCSLSFSPTNSSDEGPYAVQMVVEDFPRQNITLTDSSGPQVMKTPSDSISTMPVQFVFKGEAAEDHGAPVLRAARINQEFIRIRKLHPDMDTIGQWSRTGSSSLLRCPSKIKEELVRQGLPAGIIVELLSSGGVQLHCVTMLSSVLLLLLITGAQAAYYGAVITNSFGDVQPFVLTYNFIESGSSCQEVDIWHCGGNCTTPPFYAIDESRNEWCQKTEVRIYTTYGPRTFAYQHSYFAVLFPNHIAELITHCRVGSSNWIENRNGIVTPLIRISNDFRNRSDISKPNSTPQTTILPLVRVPSNCQRNINLLTFDPDGDNVKCRYGSDPNNNECYTCTAPSVLSLSSSCSLSFSPTSSSVEGSYAVQLMIEDFPRQTITLTHNDGSTYSWSTSNFMTRISVQLGNKAATSVSWLISMLENVNYVKFSFFFFFFSLWMVLDVIYCKFSLFIWMQFYSADFNSVNMLPSVLLLLLLISGAQASFYGVVFNYAFGDLQTDPYAGYAEKIPIYQLFAVNPQVPYDFKVSFNSCEEFNTLNCYGYCSGPPYSIDEIGGEWCQKGHAGTFYSPYLSTLTQLFGLSVLFFCNISEHFNFILCRVSASAWTENRNGIVSSRAYLQFDLRNRSDINKPNSSPRTTILPLVRYFSRSFLMFP